MTMTDTDVQRDSSSTDETAADASPVPLPETPTCISDLRPDPNNPRSISTDEMAGLAESVQEFGDLSGVVWNRRTGQLVAGHQRIEALIQRYGEDLLVVDGAVVTPEIDGHPAGRFPIRVVDWEYGRQQLANIAANNPNIQGDFTPELQVILRDIASNETYGEQLAPLRIDTLVVATQRDRLPEDEDGLSEFPDIPETDEGVMFAFGGYKGMVGLGIYRSFKAAFAEHDVNETGIIDDVLSRWLGLGDVPEGGGGG